MASSGSPVEECSPSTAQALEPMPSPRPSRAGRRSIPERRRRKVPRASAYAGRCGSRVAGLGRVLLEDAVDHRALLDDRGVLVVGVRRVELLDLGRRVVGEREHPVDLVGHVAAQVPRHRLQPGQRVDGRPRLGGVVEAAGAEHGVLDGELGGAARVEVGVDAVGVRLERGAGLRLDHRELLLGDPPPAHGPDELVGLERGVAEQLREPAGRHVPAHVHLEEPLLRVHEALRAHQVLERVAVQLRDAVVVADDRDRALQPGQVQLAVGLRERPPGQDDAGDQADDEDEHQADRDVHRDAGPGGPGTEGLPPGAVGGLGSHGTDVRLVGHGARHCAVPLAVVWAECQHPRPGPLLAVPEDDHRADLSVRLHRVLARLRAVPELQRRRADRVPRVRRPAAQALQRRRRGLQGLRLLPHRQPRGGCAPRRRRPRPREGSSKSDSGSSGGTATKTESKPAARPPSAARTTSD